ncbi:MAG: glycosyltransferase family 39 protein [Chloroflexota bacterium]
MTSSSNQQTTTIHTWGFSPSLVLWVSLIMIGCVALLPRIIGLNDFYTIDEGYHWPGRVERFGEALATQDWAATNQTGHPGVTTMWLGAMGRWLGESVGVYDPGWAGGGATYLGFLRLPLAIVNALAVVIGYVLLRRLFRADIALLASIMWATSPFIIAHSRVLHLDALLTSFITLTVLALLVGMKDDIKKPVLWFTISGVCAGLALLTKAPSFILPPLVGLLMLLLSPMAGWWPRIRWTSRHYLIWLGCAALVVFIGWPAMWVNPFEAIGSIVSEIIRNGGVPHHSGNYFLGTPVADPGWLFYPAVILWRTTPLTLIGLVLLLIGLGIALHKRLTGDRTAWSLQSPELRFTLALGLFVVLFTLMLSLQPKKFDRYLLPIWPTLSILAAIGFARLLSLPQMNKLFGLSAILLLFNLSWFHPYYLAYFNPLVGGGATAQRVMLTGWGEGMEEVGAWLNRQPDLKRGPVLSWIPPTLAPFIPVENLVLDLREENLDRATSYAVLYSRSVQREESLVAEEYVRQNPPLFTVQKHDINYATVHQIPRPFAEPIDATFGDGLYLRGFSHELVGSTLVITPSWSIQSTQPGNIFSFVHVLNKRGELVAQVDAPLDQGMFVTWEAGRHFDSPLPVPLPADLPEADYQIVMGLYNPEDGVRLPLQQGQALPEEINGPDVIELTTLQLPR